MTNVTVKRAKHIKLTYSGQGKYTATWRQFDDRVVRRVIQLMSWHDTEAAAVKAAEHFVDWINELKTELGRSYFHKLDTVTMSKMGNDTTCIAVTMETQPFKTLPEERACYVSTPDGPRDAVAYEVTHPADTWMVETLDKAIQFEVTASRVKSMFNSCAFPTFMRHFDLLDEVTA